MLLIRFEAAAQQSHFKHLILKYLKESTKIEYCNRYIQQITYPTKLIETPVFIVKPNRLPGEYNKTK